MATSYNRYINLFIDGKQVENSAKGIKIQTYILNGKEDLMPVNNESTTARQNNAITPVKRSRRTAQKTIFGFIS